MRTTWKLLLVFLIAFAGITCKKESLEPGSSTTPTVFSFSGTVTNGSSNTQVTFTAGVNNYFMYSSYTQDTNSVYNFIGSLHQTSTTTTGPNSIQFIINDYRTLANNATETNISDSSLVVNSYNYRDSGTGKSYFFDIKYTPVPESFDTNIKSYSWSFGDGTTSTLRNPKHSFLTPGKLYVTTLSVTYPGGKTASASGTIGHTLHSTITDTSWPPDSVQFTASTTGGKTPYTYTWSFGPSASPSTASTGTVNYGITSYPSAGVYTATLITTDAVNNRDTTNINVPQINDTSTSYVNFTTSPNIPDSTNSSNLSAVTIIYTDASGVTYSSANVASHVNDKFQITSVSSYQNNQNNQTTKMLHITFNCQLKSSNGKAITITRGKAVIAVAYH